MRTMLSGLLVTVMLGASPAALADEDREISREWPRGELETIDIEANVGTVRITGSDRDTISLKLKIEPDDDGWGSASERVMEIIRKAELDENISGDTLVLDLRTHASGDDDIEEHWELEVPADLKSIVELNVGEARIKGTRGGVEAEVNVGELGIDVLRGDIEAEVNVGDLDIRSATGSPGEFDLEVNIGDVDLEIDGRNIELDRGWLGGSITHDAGGDDDVSAQVNVGDVRIDIRN